MNALASFYDLGSGGLADYYCALLRNGSAVAQNREPLTAAGFGLTRVGSPVAVPVIFKLRWQYRVDLEVVLRREIVRVYPVEPLVSAQGDIVTDGGLPPQPFEAPRAVPAPPTPPAPPENPNDIRPDRADRGVTEMMRILAAALFCMVAATAARAQTETTYTLSNGLGQTYAFHAFTCAGAYCTASVPMDAATGNPLTGIAGTPPGYGMSVQGMSGMTPLQVECQSGCGVSSSNFSNPFPAVGLAVGASNGTNMLPLLVNTSGYLEVDVKTSALPAGAATAANQVTMITALGSPFQAGGSIGNSSFGATQSGSWTVTANLGTLGGAATAANQTASYGTAGSPASTVVSVQGVPSGTAVVVSAAALPLPTNAAEETGGNLAVIAGAVSSSVVQSNVKQVGGTAASTGAGAVGSGSQRVAVAQDVTTLAGSAPGTAGTPSVNVVSVQGVSSGTAVPVSATALPLPTGAATQTTLAAVLSALGTPMQNSGGSVMANLGTLGGAATAANQTSVQGTAGSPASTVVSVQGVSGGAAVPVSAASLPLPSGAATAANQEVTVAGSSALSAQAVQGVTGGVALPVSATALPLPTNAAQETGGNLATIAGAVTSSVVRRI